MKKWEMKVEESSLQSLSLCRGLWKNSAELLAVKENKSKNTWPQKLRQKEIHTAFQLASSQIYNTLYSFLNVWSTKCLYKYFHSVFT